MAAAVEAIEEVLHLPIARFSNDLWIRLDNQNVARHLLQSPVCSSQNKFLTFATRAFVWPRRSRLPHTVAENVRVYWIPSYTGSQGNALVDSAAREAAHLALSAPYPPSHTPLTAASANEWADAKLDSQMKNYWSLHAPNS